MTKFEQIIEPYLSIIKEYVPPQQQIDLTSLDKATGEQIQAGLTELLGNNPDQANQILQGLVNSKSINPNAAMAAGGGQQAAPTSTPATQQAATAKVASQGSSTPQANPLADAERRATRAV